MIRINLLGTPRAKSKRGSAASAAPSLEIGSVGSPMVKILVSVAFLAGANAYYWYYLDHQAKSIAAKMQVAEDHNRQLSVVKTKYLERQKQADNYKRRVFVEHHRRYGERDRGGLVEQHERPGRKYCDSGYGLEH